MRTLFLILALLCGHAVLAAQTPLDDRLTDVCKILTRMPPAYDSLFTTDFLKQVPKFQLVSAVGQLTSIAGHCVSTTVTSRKNAYSLEANAVTDSGYVIPVTLSIQATPPHRISGLFFGAPQKIATSFNTVIDDLKSLEGATSLCVMELNSDSTLAAHNADVSMPVGSTFKLYVLGELVRAITSDERHWEDIVYLDTNHYSLPSGELQDWPHGSPLTLHTLAGKMISVSDNTATDHLINLLGREKIERMQSTMGHHRPELNVPFLTTREMFALKFSHGGAYGRRFIAAQDRHAVLSAAEDSVRLSDVVFADTVSHIEDIEWFATTRDLCKAMDWLRRRSISFADPQILHILGINTGVDVDESAWKTVGYKGGSETGVLNLTFVLQSKSKHWYAVSLSWMNTTKDVDLTTFIGIASSTITLLQSQ